MAADSIREDKGATEILNHPWIIIRIHASFRQRRLPLERLLVLWVRRHKKVALGIEFREHVPS